MSINREPREVIDKVEIKREDVRVWESRLDQFIPSLNSDLATIFFQRRLNPVQAAKKISNKAWDRMMRARIGDFS